MNNDTTTKTCSWIGGGEGCTLQSLTGSSYCELHHHQVYRQGSASGARHRDRRVAQAVWDLEAEMTAAMEELINEGYDFAEPIWDIKTETI